MRRSPFSSSPCIRTHARRTRQYPFTAAARDCCKQNIIVNTVEDFINQQRLNLVTAQRALKSAQYNQKLQYDTKHRNVEFQVGDRVWLNTNRIYEYGQIHYPAQGPSPTFEPRNIGPYKITKKLSPNAYELDLPKSLRIQPVIHIRYLREHHPSTEFPKNRLQNSATEFRSQDDETEQPQIEEIRGKKLRKRQIRKRSYIRISSSLARTSK